MINSRISEILTFYFFVSLRVVQTFKYRILGTVSNLLDQWTSSTVYQPPNLKDSQLRVFSGAMSVVLSSGHLPLLMFCWIWLTATQENQHRHPDHVERHCPCPVSVRTWVSARIHPEVLSSLSTIKWNTTRRMCRIK